MLNIDTGMALLVADRQVIARAALTEWSWMRAPSAEDSYYQTRDSLPQDHLTMRGHAKGKSMGLVPGAVMEPQWPQRPENF